MIDRILGGAFGVARGFVIIMIPFMFYEQFKPNDQPDWVKNSISVPYLRAAGEAVRGALVRVVPSALPGTGAS